MVPLRRAITGLGIPALTSDCVPMMLRVRPAQFTTTSGRTVVIACHTAERPVMSTDARSNVVTRSPLATLSCSIRPASGEATWMNSPSR